MIARSAGGTAPACSFLIKDRHGALVGGLRILMRVAHRGQTCSSQLTQGTHHAKNDARLPRLIKVQIVPHHDVEKVVRSQRSIGWRLDVIAADQLIWW